MKSRLLSLSMVLVLAGVAVVVAASRADAQVIPTVIPATEVRFSAVLLGREEAPGPGDPDGFGFALTTIDLAEGRVCYLLYAVQIGNATAAHIHRGPPGVAGPIVVNFSNVPSASAPISTGCTTGVSRDLIQEIIASPGSFYVNIHNAEFPAGAIRGQLR
jgi:hypothetical protein